ncbi:MAG: Nramp family divalent metal transporter [Bacteroidales bacterium]|nr:Nramp family divalent metal transporter [Bacteroidales bacterium]
MPNTRTKFIQTLTLFLPGIFLVGSNIGTGSVTTMAAAGANYGMSLLWTILISCLATAFLISIYGKFTLVTGETALQAFRKHIHPTVGIFFIVALTAAVSGSVMGVMGIISDISYEWSKGFIDGGIDAIYFAMFYITIVYIIFWGGKTKIFQRALAATVSFMGVCFIINFFIMMPPPYEIVKGLLPSVPDIPADADKNPYLVIAGMVGTTVFSGMFILRTTLVKEAGWTIVDFNHQRKDAIISASLMFLISAAIMAAAAGTIYTDPNTLGLENAVQMITLLEPLAGSVAVAIFALGIIAAGIGCMLPNLLMLPWLLCDYNNQERDMKQPKYRMMVVLIGLLGLVVPIFNARPILVMIISQALSSVLLPLTTASILYLANRKSIMKEHTNKLVANIILFVILLFSLFNSYTGLSGIGVNIDKLINPRVEETLTVPNASLETHSIKF